MRKLSKEEIMGLILILLIIGGFSIPGFRDSLMRARDAQRKNDIGSLATALRKYNEDFGFYPMSSPNGKILACNPVTKINENFIFSPCKFGSDGLRDLSDASYLPYISTIPTDPNSSNGLNYFYISDGKYFQLYAVLEDKSQDEYNSKIILRGLKCGTKKCNFGQSDGKTPLDKSLQEYENEINAQNKK
ncbi:hypothetical protein HY045_00060 [Candidatus Woesebacteria bacterium]|nr:hypothetical protein [Candidatus Woesebacteria bacterium]